MQAVAISRVKREALKDQSYMGLVSTVSDHVEDWPDYLQLYKKYRKEIGTDDGLAYYKGRVIVPPTLRPAIIKLLHSAHQGLQGRIERASQMVWWPKINEDLERDKKSCEICNQVAPSNHKEPPKGTVYPEWPFQQVCADYFDLGGSKYLVIVDRFTSYPLLWKIGPGTCGTRGLITMMMDMMQLFGVPEEITSDGGGEFIGKEYTQFLSRWNIRQRLSSAYEPHGNRRAEVAVKSMKRAIRGRTGQGGSLEDGGGYGRPLGVQEHTGQGHGSVTRRGAVRPGDAGTTSSAQGRLPTGRQHPPHTGGEEQEAEEEVRDLRPTTRRTYIGPPATT